MSADQIKILAVDDDPDALFIMDLTASARTETRMAAMALGVSDFVTKPLNSRDLLARIRAQLHQRQLADDLDPLLRKSN